MKKLKFSALENNWNNSFNLFKKYVTWFFSEPSKKVSARTQKGVSIS